MSLTKYAAFDTEILDIKGARTRQHTASLDKLADFENYRTNDGYLYVRIRAISSRVNKNHDGWPSIELAGNSDIFERHHGAGGFTIEAADGPAEQGFATFVGKPIFVDHHNSSPKRARGVIVDAKLNVLDHKTAAKDDSYWGGHDVDAEHMPPTEVELLLEVDAKTFPRLAQAIVSGDLDGFSMGCDVEYSKCSHCGHIASAPDEYCSHIMMKGAHHDIKTADGHKVSKKSYENCYGIHFFEISAVFDPADETALAREVRSAVHKEAEEVGMNYPSGVDNPLGGVQNEITELAAQYVQKGVDLQSAMDMAHRKILKERGLGGGEGYTSPADSNALMHRFDSIPKGIANPEADFDTPILQQHNDPRWSSQRTAENPLPQDMMTRAPEEVDTMREEQLCPICGNDMEAETCQVCGYVSPPKEFDNPDLDKAQQIREEMKQQEEQPTDPQAAQEPGAAPGGPAAPGPAGAGAPPMPAGPTKAPVAAKVTNDMRSWTPKVHPKQAAQLAELARTANTSAQAPIIPLPEPAVTPAMATARQLMANAQRNHTGANMHTRTADGPTPPGDTSPKTRTDVTGVGGVDQASNEEASKAQAQIDVVGVGTTGVSDVAADSSETLPTAGKDSMDAGFNTDKTTEDSGPTKTFGDSDGGHSGVTDPVTSETPSWVDESKWSRVAYEDGTLEAQEQQGDPVAQGGTAVKGVQPIAEQFGERVNVLEHTTSPSNNSGPTTTWTGTDGNGVLKQQDPVTRDSQEWGGVKVPDVTLHTNARTHFMAAMRLAEMEAELGLIAPADKFNRFAELEQQPTARVTAQIETLSRVKTAGLAKLAQQRQAGVRRLPTQFGKKTSAPHGFERIAADTAQPEPSPIGDDVLDAALFTR